MSALKSGMDRKTALKYVKRPELLSEPRPARDWRTRADPLAVIWREAEPRLRTAPELEAKALFEHLLLVCPEQVHVAQLRTFQRRVREWRLVHGPAPEVIFPQTHSPGEVMQVDWTHAKELEVSIAGRPLDHLLCQAVLPYSNWQWATRCQSESLLSLRAGLQAALFRLGKVPKLLQIDNSSAATHQISGEGKRDFNPEFLSLVEHYGLAARTIHVGCPNENGDVESHNGHLKRRLEQHLLLRGTRDFDYRHVIQALLRKPGAFARYHYREELFPSSTYRRAYDRLVEDHGTGPGELEYLRLLKLTAELGLSAIEGLLSEMLGVGTPPWRTATLRGTLCPPPRVELVEPTVDLSV